MFRALLELLVTVLVVMLARSILTSIFSGIASASRGAPQSGPSGATGGGQSPRRDARVPVAGELHKDPVCGTYVSESTPYKRHIGGQSFYYCSDACLEKHALVAR